MSDTETAPASDSKTSTPERSFLARLTSFGDEIIPAERPAISDVSKVLGALIHWVDQGGGFEAPESFNPAISQAVAEQEAEQGRLAAQNAELSTRLASLETLMRQQIAAAGAAQPAPVAPTPAVEAETPEATGEVGVSTPTAPAPASAVPGVADGTITAPPEAAAAPVAPAPPVSE
ncbi:MAG TPA: hypothetical protein VHU24_03205 [Solirubrobacterales bacterium]|jgi:hypothetical protein|nr:hypothetical protein [Solirubrobacterales bacterium]